MPLLDSDLYQIMVDCINGTLKEEKVQWSLEKYAVGVVVVSGGYPGSYPKGKIITGLLNLNFVLRSIFILEYLLFPSIFLFLFKEL